MRTRIELDRARTLVTQYLADMRFSKDQRLLLQGMSVALQWTDGQDDGTLGRLVAGEAMAPGRTGGDLAIYVKSGEVLTALKCCYECIVQGGSQMAAIDALQKCEELFAKVGGKGARSDKG